MNGHVRAEFWFGMFLIASAIAGLLALLLIGGAPSGFELTIHVRHSGYILEGRLNPMAERTLAEENR